MRWVRGPFWLHAGLLTAALLLAGCGVPVDDSPQAIAAELPTAAPATATPPPVETELFPIYLVDGEPRLQQALREVPKPPNVQALIAELTQEPTAEETELALVSFIPAETTFADDPDVTDGLASLDFVGGTSIDTLEGESVRLALAQLVWTLTESPSIDRIVIRIDGEDQAWPTDAEDSTAPLTRDDYESLGPDFVEPTPTPVDEGEVEPPSEGDEPQPNAEPTPADAGDPDEPTPEG